MVERPEQWTKRHKYSYSFDFQFRSLYRLTPHNHYKATLTKLYHDDGLSAKQIADQFDVSKTVIIERLKELGISKGKTGRMNNPENYRAKDPPYGWKKKDGKLVLNKSEIKICRRVVLLLQDGRSYTSVAKTLTSEGFKNRVGRVNWDHKTVANIFKRWKDKL